MTDQKKKRIRAKNGDLFKVRDGKRDLAICLVARGNHKPGILGYFFDLGVMDGIQSITELKLSPELVCYIGNLSYLQIRDGNWPYIGRLTGFIEADWPMPWFHNPNTGELIRYNEIDLDVMEECLPIQPDSELLKTRMVIPDVVSGAQAIEIVIRQILDGERPRPCYNFGKSMIH